MNEDVNGSRKLFWKEVSNEKGGKVESCSIVKDRNRNGLECEVHVDRVCLEHVCEFK